MLFDVLFISTSIRYFESFGKNKLLWLSYIDCVIEPVLNFLLATFGKSKELVDTRLFLILPQIIILFHLGIHSFEQILISPRINIFLDYQSIEYPPPLQIFIHIQKVIGFITVEISILLSSRQFIFDDSSRILTNFAFHYLLHVDSPNIIDYPLDFNLIDIDSWSHGQVMNYLVCHHFDVLFRLA